MSDHNKCPSSEKEHEKCIFRLSYFHRIEPNYTAHSHIYPHIFNDLHLPFTERYIIYIMFTINDIYEPKYRMAKFNKEVHF